MSPAGSLVKPSQVVADALARYAEAAPRAVEQPATGRLLGPGELAALIDHTLLKPDATAGQIRQLCQEARSHGFASVCVNPTWVPLCAQELAGSAVKVCTVAGFPLGATLAAAKGFEAARAVAAGAHEVDMVMNVGRLKSGDYAAVWDDVAAVVQAAQPAGARVKVIIETGLLTEEEKVAACALVQAVGADFVKTCTGFSGGSATVADVALMRWVVGPEMGVKAAGGVRTAADAYALIAAGATRIGASAGIRIVQDAAALSAAGAPGPAVQETEGY
jgi:deoxyribose-phosphate aldolase